MADHSVKYLLVTIISNVTNNFPYSFSATHVYSPLSVISPAVKIRTLSLLVFGQDEQESGNDQLYTGSGDADAVQFSIIASLIFIVTVSFCLDTNIGESVHKIIE